MNVQADVIRASSWGLSRDNMERMQLKNPFLLQILRQQQESQS